ncbi:MAG: HAD superfamily hydrolase [Microgenomates group bacterium Gr01-1014_7]|nr:MAG: HAD superfamily hydrolase [Microgenomates group bacterium Gr01-1014_7]
MKIVLFDIDDTLLVCGNETNVNASRKMFKQVFEIDADEDMIDNKGKTDKQIIGEVVALVKGCSSIDEVKIPSEAFQVWAETLEDLLNLHPARILPGITELLDALSKKANVLLGLLTGNSPSRAKIKLENTKLEKYFKDKSGLIGAFGDITNIRADLIRITKEKYRGYTHIIIDDSLIGAKMAKDSNVESILVATGNASAEELKEYSDYVFPDFGEGRWREAVEVIENI